MIGQLVILLLSIAFAAAVNGVLTYLLGTSVKCWSPALNENQTLFWAGFMVTMLSVFFGLLFAPCQSKGQLLF